MISLLYASRTTVPPEHYKYSPSFMTSPRILQNQPYEGQWIGIAKLWLRRLLISYGPSELFYEYRKHYFKFYLIFPSQSVFLI